MKKLFIVILFFALAILAVQSNTVFAETKKVLVLHIIEENWDDLEFRLPLYRGGPPKPITKKEALRDFDEYKGKALKKDPEIKRRVIDDIGKTMRLESKTGISPQKAQSESIKNNLYIKHKISYLGKAYYLKKGETFIREAFRGGFGFRDKDFDYYYDGIPEKVSLLFEPKEYDKTRGKPIPHIWRAYFEEIRLVEDIYVTSVDNSGNLKMKYNNKEYSVKVGSVLELPVHEEKLTRQEMMKFREKYFKYYEKTYPWIKPREKAFITSSLSELSIPNESFHFGTKVTIINHGFEEIQGE